MSESEVSHIRDEDVLRRMWQQTEDFSRKKEIRAHMYRLREERLRNLYSPEPVSDGKGCEFTSSQGHVKSFADQTFQSMKSKEVRDAGSPPKEFTYRGQDLKELSNAGWNVESEDRTTDDGRTHVKSVNANIEGQYDVEGGRGQFAAVDRQRHAVTEHRDDNSSLHRDETCSDTAAHEHVVRQTDDGALFSSTTTSSNTSSKIQQVSSTKHETVPYVTDDDYDLRRHASQDTNRNDRVTRITDRNDYEQTLRKNDFDNAELVSRKVEYPDSNTKVIVETRCLPDGTRVTSTRREFRAPAQSTRSESYQTKSESKSYSSHHTSDSRDSTSKVTRRTIDNRTDDIVDSQRNVDDSDFKRQIRQYVVQDDDDHSNTQRHVIKSDRKVSDYSQTENSQTNYETRINKKIVDRSTTNRDDRTQTQRRIVDQRDDNRVDETDRRQVITSRDHDIQHNVVKEIHHIDDTQERTHNITMDSKDSEIKSRDTTTRDRTDIEEIRSVSRDDKVTYDRIRDIPKDRNNIPQTPQDIPRAGQRPYERNRDVPKDVEYKNREIPKEKKVSEERMRNVTRNTSVDEVVERKTSSDHYQTTYQNDFQSRKVSTDWSPTHQAWASTLRSDTPSTTRPSTRASSPGSRTFKSSTSSLRSSVSPDKTFRKPSSRGGSPNKIDRHSPSRTITSDRYSSTHSTQSINETKTSKTTSPERKPPTGRSPGSPDRKPQDVSRQRPSASPEKRPQSFKDRPYLSPERKPSTKSIPTDGHPQATSPQRNPTDDYPNRSSPRSSPDRKLGYQKPLDRPTDGIPISSTPRFSVSPDRKSGYEKPSAPRSSPSPDRKPGQDTTTGLPRTTSPSRPLDKTPAYQHESEKNTPDKRYPEDTKRPSLSPERKPGYMRPTAASQPDTRRPSQLTDELNRKSQPKQIPAQSPDHKPSDVNKTTTKIKEDHYRIVDEETKIYTQSDTIDTNKKGTKTPTPGDSRPRDKTPVKEVQGEDTPDSGIFPKRNGNSPSRKETLVITENDDLYGRVDKTVEKINTIVTQDNQADNITTIKHTQKNRESPANKDISSRETSPTKYGTYDKKKPHDINTTVVTTFTETTDIKDSKSDSLTRRNKTAFPDIPSSPTKKSPRDSTSPLKSPTKFKNTTDFITMEKTTEEINKKTTSKDHPRQLVTPSSSPTRKPKIAENEPSTGQSSPTTSVSGFVYFGSPRPDRPIVTDLDEFYPDSENPDGVKKPETLDVKRSPSPSKIPCRSPSPEKHVPTTKDSLPRKSSLKKPSTVNLASPIEKPPTHFSVSPSDDKPGSHEPETGEPKTGEPSSTVKPKPPLQRRETYEDRCKKILGMVDDTKTSESKTTKETTSYTKKTRPSQSSPSVSPCESPVPKESSKFSDFPSKKISTDAKVDVTDFIAREQEHIINTTITRENKPKSQSRENSPMKLQDITRETSTTNNITKEIDENSVIETTTIKYPSSRQSPEKSCTKDKLQKRPSKSPERKPFNELPKKATSDKPRDSSPTKLSRPSEMSPSRSSLSPERKYPKEASPQRRSPEKTQGYSKTMTTATSQYDTTTTTDNAQETTRITNTTKKYQPTRVLESPTRQMPRSTQDLQEKTTKHPRTTSPSKFHVKNGSPDRNQEPRNKDVKPDEINPDGISNRPKVTENLPGYMKSTAAITSKFDSTTIGDVKETHISKTTIKKEPSSLSPTRPTPQDIPRSPSPTKSNRPSDSSPKRSDSSPQRKSKETPTKQPKYNTTAEHPRTPSPTKQSRSSDISPVRKHIKQEPSPQPKRPSDSSPTRPESVTTPGYMKSTITSTSKFDNYDSEDIEEAITSTIVEKHVSNPKRSRSPARKEPQSTDDSSTTYPTPKKQDLSPERKPSDKSNKQKPADKQPQVPRSDSPTKTPGYMKTTTSVAYKYETIATEDNEVNTAVHKKYDSEAPTQDSPKTGRPRSISPSTLDKSPRMSATSPERKRTLKSPERDDAIPQSKLPKDSPVRSSVSPDRPSYMKPTASVISKFDSISTTSQDTQEVVEQRSSPRRAPESPTRDSFGHEPKDRYIMKSEEPKKLRTPSPIKKITKTTEVNTDFIISEREQEILDKVQKSLRKLSPERKEKSPSRERSPTKSTTSLQDLDIITNESVEIDEFTNRNLSEIVEEQITETSSVTRPGKPKQPHDNKTPSKPSSRTVSPNKKAPATISSKMDKSPESPTKSRSISPKKPISYVDRPKSPQVPKSSGIKPREQIPGHLTRKPTPATLATTKIERVATEVKKTNGVTKHNVFNKTTTTTASKTVSKSIPSHTGKPSEPESKRPTYKGVKDHIIPKKDAVTRTTSEITMKPKKTSSPQRMKSKPEIQVSDMSTKSPKSPKPIIKEPHSKLPNKPKSATALNTSTDEDDIIIDVQQSKSSRENSPDRICPTPINFSDDVGTPRFPDEVSEPDDDFVKRTHHTIHETETVVDDIVEICEDEELFVKKPQRSVTSVGDDSLLSVNDKVNKFTNKMRAVTKPKDTTNSFKDIERRVHSDFINENLKSDECLLTVSEKVTKFAKGPRDTKDNRNPSRKITDEYDKDTVYQDDYTKLSVNDKANLFIETAENVKVTKVKSSQKVERPDLSNVDETLKSDDCLLSVSDKVSKFVKTAENILTDTQVSESTEKKMKDHVKISRQTNVEDEDDDEIFDRHEIINPQPDPRSRPEDKSLPHSKEPKLPQSKVKDYSSPTERVSTKITTLRSSEAVKKAKALFENIASTQKTKETTHTTKTNTKLTDIGVVKKSPKTDSTTALHPSTEDTSYVDSEVDASLFSRGHPSSGTPAKPQYAHGDEKPRSSPNRVVTESPEVPRSKSPLRQSVEITTTKTVISRYPTRRAESPRNRPESPMQRTESPRQRTESPRQRTDSPRQRTESPRLRLDSDKSDKVPGYLRPTMTSQIKEEPKLVEEPEVSSRRGSGKFGVELRRTSVDRSTVSSERRRSVEHHQPCIEDIFDLDLLEQMLEKVTGYEQRRRIRAQIRVARNQSVDTNTYKKTTKTTSTVTKTRSPERKPARSPERIPKSAPQKTSSPDRQDKLSSIMNGHAKEPAKTPSTRQRPNSPEKPASKSTLAPKTPVRQPSPDKRRPVSPSKTAPKPKSNRFSEYASAYMKKIGLNESEKVRLTEAKTRKTTEAKQTVKHEKEETVQEFTTTKTFNERTSSRDVIEIVKNGKRSPSPGKKQSPERKAPIPDRKTQSPEWKAHSPSRKVASPDRHAQSPDRLYQRTPSPDFKRPKADTLKETVIKTVNDIEKKIPLKQVQEEKPSWVTNRNLKKITTESRTYSTKKMETEKPKYRAASPSKVISKPTDVITSSYGPGPLDADGRPLFGIKALRNGATNFQVKGTVIRQEFHSRNGGAPEGTVSVTAYSSQPEELEQLLASQGVEAPSKLHGLSAITTTKKFGGDTGHSLSNVHTKEDRASLEHFTHADRKIESRVENLESRTYDAMDELSSTRRIDSRNDRLTDKDRTVKREERSTEMKRGKVEERRERVEKREDKKTVRQSSVKLLTDKYIKSANDSSKGDRTSYPKAGLILRTTSMRDSVSSDEAHPGVTRADSDHSVGSGEDTVVTTTECTDDGVRTTTTTRTTHHGPTVTHTTKTSTVHEPIITKKTSTLIAQEPLITKKNVYITQEGGKVTQSRQGTTTVTTERSFLDSNSKVTGVQDILTRMKNADIVIQEGDTAEDSEARALLNKFLGATVLMAGMQGYVSEQPEGKVTVRQETVRSTGGGGKVTSSRSIEEFDIDHCWDERLLKKLLDECTDYEQRRRLRARIRTLMAEQEACASAVTEALGAAGAGGGSTDGGEAREEEEVTVTSSVRRDSSDKTVSSSTTTTKTSKVIEMTRPAPKPVSPFAKFRQLEKQNSTNSPNSPKSPQSPGSPSQPYFKFTDPALQCSALTIKERLLQWCRDKTRDYENVKLENFSTSWADGLAFCALVHHFLPHTFDYSKLTPERRRHNFTLAFKVADEKAGIYPLLDVDDMVAMRKPDWKCVFTYVQAIYRRFKDED